MINKKINTIITYHALLNCQIKWHLQRRDSIYNNTIQSSIIIGLNFT